MKKLFLFVLLTVTVMLSACDNIGSNKKPEETSVTTVVSPTKAYIKVTANNSLTYEPGSIKQFTKEELDYELTHNPWAYIKTHRDLFYTVDGFYMNIVGEKYGWEKYREWRDEFDRKFEATLDMETGLMEEVKEMILVTMIKHFDISKEDFIKATEKYRKAVEKDSNEKDVDLSVYEWLEIPNVEVIYTFDNDLISEYYRRE